MLCASDSLLVTLLVTIAVRADYREYLVDCKGKCRRQHYLCVDAILCSECRKEMHRVTLGGRASTKCGLRQYGRLVTCACCQGSDEWCQLA